MASARDALNARIRELIDRRLGREVTSAREEAAEYIRMLFARGFTSRQIGDRVGVSRNTVACWGRGVRSPATCDQFQRLAMLARNALALPVRVTPKYSGMRLVLDTLRSVRGCSWRQLERDLGLSPGTHGSSVGLWMSGKYKPHRRATLAIRALASAAGLPPDMLALCDVRLQEISDAGRRLAQTEGRTETTDAA